jgi:hypothetical protein
VRTRAQRIDKAAALIRDCRRAGVLSDGELDIFVIVTTLSKFLPMVDLVTAWMDRVGVHPWDEVIEEFFE